MKRPAQTPRKVRKGIAVHRPSVIEEIALYTGSSLGPDDPDSSIRPTFSCGSLLTGMTSTELNRQFSIANALRFETASGGLIRAVISTPLAEAEIYQQGAHIAQWTPRGRKPVLFMSSQSFLDSGKPIRGGVPVIFPWFGPRSGDRPGPAHGFVRTVPWAVDSAALLNGGAVEIAFTLAAGDVSRALGFDAFALRFTLAVGSELSMSLDVANQGEGPLVFEEALHTYFAVSGIRGLAVHGLEGTTYIDKTDSFTRKLQSDAPIRIGQETDRVYLNTTAACVISDPAWDRRIVIRKTGSNSAVVWNPWIAKTASLADMAPDDWQGMICVETANVTDNAVTLAPGETHRMTASISIV
jgi:glucose-6-phosphate 1-epimerase